MNKTLTNGELFLLFNCGMGTSKRTIAWHAGCTRQNVQILIRKYLARHPQATQEYASQLPLSRTAEGMKALEKLSLGEDVDMGKLYIPPTHGKPPRRHGDKRTRAHDAGSDNVHDLTLQLRRHTRGIARESDSNTS